MCNVKNGDKGSSLTYFTIDPALTWNYGDVKVFAIHMHSIWILKKGNIESIFKLLQFHICASSSFWCEQLFLLSNKWALKRCSRRTNDWRAGGNLETNDPGVETNFETLNICEVIFELALRWNQTFSGYLVLLWMRTDQYPIWYVYAFSNIFKIGHHTQKRSNINPVFELQ